MPRASILEPGKFLLGLRKRSKELLREDHIRSAAVHVNHMLKALTTMNIRLKEVLSQAHGVSGLKIIRAILPGERDPEFLVEMCDSRILKTKKEQVIKSLKGHYSQAGLFALEQAVTCYDFYQLQIGRCDEKLSAVLKKMIDNKPVSNQTQKHRKPVRHHKPDIKNLYQYLLTVFGNKDATVLPGIKDYNWMQLPAEVGIDLKKWKPKNILHPGTVSPLNSTTREK